MVSNLFTLGAPLGIINTNLLGSWTFAYLDTLRQLPNSLPTLPLKKVGVGVWRGLVWCWHLRTDKVLPPPPSPASPPPPLSPPSHIPPLPLPIVGFEL